MRLGSFVDAARLFLFAALGAMAGEGGCGKGRRPATSSFSF